MLIRGHVCDEVVHEPGNQLRRRRYVQGVERGLPTDPVLFVPDDPAPRCVGRVLQQAAVDSAQVVDRNRPGRVREEGDGHLHRPNIAKDLHGCRVGGLASLAGNLLRPGKAANAHLEAFHVGTRHRLSAQEEPRERVSVVEAGAGLVDRPDRLFRVADVS